LVVDRRAFIGTVAGGLLAAPLAGEAQPTGKVPRIGFLTGGSEAGSRTRFEAFREGLRELATWTNRPSPSNTGTRTTTTSAFQYWRLSWFVSTSPSLWRTDVMFETADPVGSNLVSNLARPGGNITGVAQLVDTDLFGKQLEMLKEIVPKLSRVGLLFNPANPVQWTVLRSTQVAAQVLGVTVQPLSVRNPGEFEREVATATRNRIGALIVTRDNIFVGHIGRLVDLAAQHRLPTMYGSRAFANAGGLIAYGPSPADSARRAAVYVDKILKGAKPGDLPVEQPTRYDLVINLKTAKALGLTIPPSLLQRADQVIE